jgi:hypothetical protein
VSKYRRAAKIDSNQAEIVRALRSIPGVMVEVGHDDILVGRSGLTYWLEIKEPSTVSPVTGLIRESAKKDSQKRLEKEWAGHYRIVSSLDQILREIGL